MRVKKIIFLLSLAITLRQELTLHPMIQLPKGNNSLPQPKNSSFRQWANSISSGSILPNFLRSFATEHTDSLPSQYLFMTNKDKPTVTIFIDEESKEDKHTDRNLQEAPSYPAFRRSLLARIALKQIRKKDIETVINNYLKDNKKELTSNQKKAVASDALKLSYRTTEVRQNLSKKIDDLINKKILSQQEIDNSIRDAETQRQRQYNIIFEKGDKDLDRQDIIKNYYNDTIKKRYNYRDYIDNKIKNLETNSPELASQQPVFIKRNREKDIQFYTEFFNILEEIEIEPIEVHEIEEIKTRPFVSFEAEKQEEIKNDLVSLSINLKNLNRFIQKSESNKIDQKKIDILKNVQKSFLWINNIFSKPHPSSENKEFDSWLVENFSSPFLSQKEVGILPEIHTNISNFIQKSEDFFKEALIKNAVTNASLEYICKDILHNKSIADIIQRLFIPLTIVTEKTIQNSTEVESLIKEIKSITESNQFLMRQFSLQKFFDTLIKKLQKVDRNTLQRTTEDALDSFRKNVMATILKQTFDMPLLRDLKFH